MFSLLSSKLFRLLLQLLKLFTVATNEPHFEKRLCRGIFQASECHALGQLKCNIYREFAFCKLPGNKEDPLLFVVVVLE